MKHSALSSLSVLSLFIGTLTLVGCGGAFNMPDSSVSSTEEVAGPPISGSVFGGHAPIQNAHVYLLQPNTAGYGGVATSLLGNNGATSANGYVLTTNVNDPHVPTTGTVPKYVTTDANGLFSLTGAYTCVVGEPVYIYAWGGNFGGTTINNKSIVQLLTLGNCPSSGNFSTANNGALQFVYLNEVSTVATAYTFQPFTTTANNDAWHIGSSGSTQALLGIANAANTAAQIYNIQGSSTLISTSYDGEGHLANVLTPAGNGIIPQATVDTLANILANCVDSAPTAVNQLTAQCNTLFSTATQDGTSTGTNPTDSGTAAMYIARYPAGNSSSTNVNAAYVADIFALQTGTVPYVPDLAHAPNDWTIAINYPVAGRPYSTSYTSVSNLWAEEAESIAIDDLGQVWVTGQGETSIVRINNLGVIQPSTAQTYLGYIAGYVSVDGSNNAWTGSANSSTAIFEAGSNGVFSTTYGSGYQSSYTNIADNAGNDYFFATAGSAGAGMYEYPVGAATNSTPNHYSLATSGFSAANNVAHGAIDASHDFWLTSETDTGGPTGNYQIAKVSSTGTNLWVYNTTVDRPEFVAIDANGTGWIPSQSTNGPVYKITTGGTSTSLTSGTTGTNPTGATWSYPFGSAVDGNGNVWITNRCGAYNDCTYPSTASSTLVELNGTGTSGTVNKSISPRTNYLPETQYPATATTFTKIMPDPLNIAIDPSGNIWMTNYTGNAATGSVVEIVGSAAPVVTPLSAAAGTSKLGAKP